MTLFQIHVTCCRLQSSCSTRACIIRQSKTSRLLTGLSRWILALMRVVTFLVSFLRYSALTGLLFTGNTDIVDICTHPSFFQVAVWEWILTNWLLVNCLDMFFIDVFLLFFWCLIRTYTTTLRRSRLRFLKTMEMIWCIRFSIQWKKAGSASKVYMHSRVASFLLKFSNNAINVFSCIGEYLQLWHCDCRSSISSNSNGSVHVWLVKGS